MKLNHNEYLEYEVPDNWCAEYDENGTLLLYDPNGEGAMTASFYTQFDFEKPLNVQISEMAKSFVDQCEIKLHRSMILLNQKEKLSLSGTGSTDDGQGFAKLWIVAKTPKIVLVTYFSDSKSKELKICDAIIESMKFNL